MNRFVFILPALLLLSGCLSLSEKEPLPLVGQIDLERYMGKWYVIAATPTLFDSDAYNAIEIYEITEGGIDITYQFNEGGFNGELETINSVGKIENPGVNSDWNIQFIWPFQADYKIIYLADDYSTTIVGHPSRKYVWIMSRTPSIPSEAYSDLILYLQDLGFNIGDIRRIPQSWN